MKLVWMLCATIALLMVVMENQETEGPISRRRKDLLPSLKNEMKNKIMQVQRNKTMNQTMHIMHR